jgi:DNA-binding transcriptional MerR regulator
MLKIGEFSKLSLVSIKTLRFYDEIGLFKPASIDHANGYRYYSIDQLRHMDHIKALKDLGFSLVEVGQILLKTMSKEELRSMLIMKLTDLKYEEEVLQLRQKRLRNRLKHLEEEDFVSDFEVIIKAVDGIRAITLREVVENYKSGGPLYDKLYGALAHHNVRPAGACMAVYYDEGYKEKDVDMEAVVPIGETALDLNTGLTAHELPAIKQMAALIRQGPYDDFSPAYQALITWITENGYQIIGPNREIYLQGPGDGVQPKDFLVEIQFPVQKRA